MTTADQSVGPSDGAPTVLPLTAAQRGMWFAETLSADYSVNIAQYLDIRYAPGELDHDLFAQCNEAAGKAAESPYLRIVENDGIPGQVVDVDYDQHVDIMDLRSHADPVAAALKWMRAEYKRPVDLLNDQLVVCVLLRVADDRTFWYTRGHHIIIDGFAALTLTRMTVERYNAARRGTELAEKPGATMAEIVADEHKYLDSTRRVSDAEYWQERVRGMPERVTLSKVAGTAPVSPDNVVAGSVLDAELQGRIEQLAADANSSLAVILTAAFSAFLGRMAATDDVVLSLPVTGRSTAKIKRAGGMLSNLLPVRVTELAERSGRDLIAATQLELTGALRHQRYRSDDIRRDAGFDGGSYAFGPSINMVFFDEPVEIDGATVDYRILASGILEDLLINLYQASPGAPLVVDLHGNPNLYTPGELQTHHRRFIAFVDRFVADPDRTIADIDLFLDGERDVVEKFSVGEPPAVSRVAPATVVGAFVAEVATHPDRVMVTDGGKSWTFAQFDSLARDFAQRLVGEGVAPGDRVVVQLDRGIAQMVAIYGTLYAGAAYVPLDPSAPQSRRAAVIETVSPRLIVDARYVESETFDAANATGSFVPQRVASSMPAYVLFTSGSTGTPKGVQVSHAALTAFLRWHLATFPMEYPEVMLQKAPFIFDASVPEIFGGAIAGCRTVLVRPGGHADPAYLADLIAAEHVTFAQFVPSLLDAFFDVAEAEQLSRLDSLRYLILGGEAFDAKLAARATAALPGTVVVNAYGPTEATVDITAHRIGDHHGATVPIGRPVNNAVARVLDAQLGPVPVGVAGELYVSGVQLADGYHGQCALTAERFVADPTSVGGRLYRTGDRARWNADGTLEYLGREDFQVKIRGQRVELGEIEAVLRAHSAVDTAVVVVRADGATNVLVGYVKSLRDTHELSGDDLRTWSAQHLPSHMVPATIVVLAEMPLTPTGKLDRAALPNPELTQAAYEFVAPRSEIELTLAAMLSELLGVERIGMRDNLFTLGADSLVAARLASRLRTSEKINLPLTDVFASRDIGELARAAEAAGAAPDRIPLAPMRRGDSIPLSYPQTRLWFINRMDPTSSTYNMPGAVRLGSDTDSAAMTSAVADLLIRHESLRTRFPAVDGEPVQEILDVEELGPETALRVVAVAEAELAAKVDEEAKAGFDLIGSTPMRSTLFVVTNTAGVQVDSVLMVVLHHIAGDGASLRPLITDLLTAYAARRNSLAPDWDPLPIQYADFAIWQRDMLGAADDPTSRLGTEISFWERELAGMPDILALPTDRPRPRVPSGVGAYFDTELPAELVPRIRGLAAAAGVTTFTVLHAALSLVLSRLADTDDVAIGTAVAGRDEPETADLVGMFVNTVILRSAVTPSATVADVIADAHRVRTRALEHSNVPFEQVVDAVAPYRSRSHSPLFQVALILQRDSISALTGGDTITWLDARPDAAKMDLEISATEVVGTCNDALSVQFCYATDIFDRSTIEEISGQLTRMITAMVTDPGQIVGRIDIVDDAEIGRLTAAPATVESAQTVRALIAAGEATADPMAAAIMGNGSMTYGLFTARTNQLARELISREIGANDVVAISIPRSHHSVVAMVAVAKTGAAFVMIDPRHPADRRAELIAEGGAVLGLTVAEVSEPASTLSWLVLDDANDELQLAGHSGRTIADDELVRPLHPDDMAYILFTSGSTGKPKAAVVNNRAISHLAANAVAKWGLDTSSRMLHVGAPSFDGAMGELWPAMFAGSGIVVADFDSYAGESLEHLIAEHGATHACMTPAVVATLNPLNIPTFRDVACGGEALPPELVHRWVELGDRRIYNIYGPTEVAVWATCGGPFELNEDVTIGMAGRGVGALVLDRGLRPVPVGVVGELYLTGDQVGLGYFKRHDLTAGRFVADPFTVGQRMYRTGDRVTRRADGRFDYHGRNDFQLKIRGQRIEPGELDAALMKHPDVTNAVSVGVPGPAGDKVLASYVTVVPGAIVNNTDLVDYIATHLPEFLVPRAIKIVDEFARTPIGKIDRKQLPPIDFTSTDAFVAPRTQLEAVVADIFAQVLGLDTVSVNESFFDLGGNSLSATKVTARIAAAVDREVPVAALFEAETVARLAEYISGLMAGHPSVPLGPRPRAEVVPLAGVQRGMWLLNRADPASPAYNVALALRLTGDLRVDALAEAIGDLVRRHETLRTSYPMINGEPVQVISPADAVLADLDVAPVTVEGDMNAAIMAVTGQGFDVTEAAPVRLALLDVADDDHVLVFVVHHISADGSSMAPLARDLMIAYAARSAGHAPPWSALPVQYADFTLWQAERLAAVDHDGRTEARRQLDYWKQRLSGVPETIDLPTDRPRGKNPSFRGGQIDFEISADLVGSLESIAREHNTTLFMVTQAAYAVLLARLAGRTDLVIGTPYAGRGEQALDGIVGMFVNSLALRTRVDAGASFTELLAQVRRDDLADMANAEIAFDSIVAETVSATATSHNPLFQVMFWFQNIDFPTLRLGDLEVSPIAEEFVPAKVDLQLTLYPNDPASESGKGERAMKAQLIYATDLFDESTAATITQRYLRVLEAVAADTECIVGDIVILTAEEQITAVAPTADIALTDLVAAATNADPTAEALSPGITFGALSAMITAMAAALPGSDADAALTMALMSTVPGLAAGGPAALDDALGNLRSNAAALTGMTADLSEGNNRT
ncbi:amino acid adenylation domain-containing protein [Gordonia sp. CPCC 205333]|uniref:amino acid adenylation domain-containing protein n=1 Tax=Gordonia sp. CPCC 205333 TaxID=3140790 RepID=UPI003AF36DD9